eukprot:jgi/Phyca11/529437/estExt2_fgenesh1_pm.C_PHYCAscaffold_430046
MYFAGLSGKRDTTPAPESEIRSMGSSGHHDLDVPLQLDNLSDLDDVIDLDDLVSSDSERPSPPVAARTSLSGSFVPGPELAIAHMEWKTLRSEGIPPDQRYDCGLAIYGSFLIVVGGIVGKLRLNDLHLLDLAAPPSPRWIKPPISGTPPLPESGEWKWEKLEVAGKPPSMRYWYSLTVLQGMAVLYGGYGHPQRLSDTFALRFDSEIPTWTELHPRGDNPGPSSTHSVCVIRDRMYIFGGYDGKYRRGQLFAFEIESVANQHIECVWRKVETQGHGPASRYTHSSASIGSQLIVYGGNTGCLKGDVYVLDLGTDDDVPIWKLVKTDPPLTPRAWHRAVTYNDAMYVFGGHTTQGNDNKVLRVAFLATAP